MTEKEAIWRLQDHFRAHDDGVPTPFLDKAAVMAYVALGNQAWLRERLKETHESGFAVDYQKLFNDIYKVFVLVGEMENELC